jgi:hypothetical protein
MEADMDLSFSDAERDLVIRILEAAHREMRVEVRRTSTPDYHDDLERDEKLLEGVIARLKS